MIRSIQVRPIHLLVNSLFWITAPAIASDGLLQAQEKISSPQEIPVLRKKVQKVVDHFALDPASHDAKAVLNVLETYPRDELFQASITDLIRISRNVVNL